MLYDHGGAGGWWFDLYLAILVTLLFLFLAARFVRLSRCSGNLSFPPVIASLPRILCCIFRSRNWTIRSSSQSRSILVLAPISAQYSISCSQYPGFFNILHVISAIWLICSPYSIVEFNSIMIFYAVIDSRAVALRKSIRRFFCPRSQIRLVCFDLISSWFWGTFIGRFL